MTETLFRFFKSVLPALVLLASPLVAVAPFPDETQAGEKPFPALTEIAAQSGIRFVHGFGDDDLSNIVETTGAGVCIFDYDNDQDLDIYFVNGAYDKSVSHARGRANAGRLRNALYRNDGKGRFTDATSEAGVGDKGFGMACLSADYDNDGDADLFVTNYGANAFYKNNGDGTFDEIAAEAGLADERWSVGCTFLDYDRDGFLDLFVGNYLRFDPSYRYYYPGNAFPGPLSYQGVADALYRNRGDGTFENVTEKAGLSKNEGRAMGVASCDMDDDGDMDVFVANDAMEKYLYRNNGDGTFTGIALETGTAFSQNGEAASAMGPEFGDFDTDGLIDLLVPDMSYSCLYRNTGEGYFQEMSAVSGLAAICGQYTSWSGNFFDFDRDGKLDIFLTNGDSRFLEPEEDVLLRNVGGARFSDISEQLGPDFRKKFIGRGSAVGDMDGDGDLDIVVNNVNSRPLLYRNDGGNRGSWLSVDLAGVKSNRDAVGTRLRLVAGETTQTRFVVSGSGYLSQSDRRAYFGLGEKEKADRLEIRWPDGKTQILKDIPANRVLTVREPDSKAAREK